VLHTEDHRVKRDKDGNIVFEFQRDGYKDHKSLAEGVAEWLGTDEGKHYAPARVGGGSGATGGQANAQGRSTAGMSKAEQKRAAKRDLMRAIILDN